MRCLGLKPFGLFLERYPGVVGWREMRAACRSTEMYCDALVTGAMTAGGLAAAEKERLLRGLGSIEERLR